MPLPTLCLCGDCMVVPVRVSASASSEVRVIALPRQVTGHCPAAWVGNSFRQSCIGAIMVYTLWHLREKEK